MAADALNSLVSFFGSLAVVDAEMMAAATIRISSTSNVQVVEAVEASHGSTRGHDVLTFATHGFRGCQTIVMACTMDVLGSHILVVHRDYVSMVAAGVPLFILI